MKEGMAKIVASKSKTFLAFCFCFLLGSTFASLGVASADKSVFLYAGLFGLLFFAIIFWENKLARFCILCLGFCVFGVWRFAITIPNCSDASNACFYNNRKVEFIGVVSEDPDMRIDQAKYTVSFEKINDTSVNGKALITTQLYPSYHYGDTLKITCKLQAPNNTDDSTFRYDKYLARHGIWSLCSFPKEITVIASVAKSRDASTGQSPGSSTHESEGIATSSRHGGTPRNDTWTRWAMKPILRLKSSVGNQINRLWNEPESSFMAGLLYGSKSGLPKELMDNFSKTGVTHIIAVSGFNVTIIVVALMFILIRLGLWRQQAYFVVVGFLFVFVVFTGATGSVVRAAVMGLLVLTAEQLGRLSRMGNVLVFTAALMVLANPYMLVWDAGFQLSFLATLGLVYISPVLEKFFPDIPWTKQTLTATLSAILATLPLILYQFGRLSLVAPLVNVLVLWIIPVLMLLGFLATVFSFIFFPLGQLIAWVAHFGLQYILILVEWFGKQPWSAAQFQLPLWGMAGIYVLIIWYVKEKSKSIKL